MPAFLRAAQRAFARADSLFRVPGLIALRAGAFLIGAVAFVSADLPFCFAHRAFVQQRFWHVPKHSLCVCVVLIAMPVSWADDLDVQVGSPVP